MSTPTKARSWMDEFLSTRDFSAIHEIRINAPPTVVYRCLLRCNFNDLWLVRLLMTIRTGSDRPGVASLRSTSAARRHGLCNFGRCSGRRACYWRCRKILASQWRALFRSYCG